MADATITTNGFLEGNYAPVSEEITSEQLEVTGRLPAALDGTYLRTGPNPRGDVPPAYHWFMGDGMVHGVCIRDGQALWYRNRWVRTDAMAAQMGEDRKPGPTQPLLDLSNTNVVQFADRILSLTETCYPYELSPELETLRRTDFDGRLPHGLTAHPKIDPLTGELHAFSYWFEEPYLIYHVIDTSGRVRTTEPISLPAPVSMHDFAITRNNVVFFDQPAVLDFEAFATRGFPAVWRPENGARVGVLPRDGTDHDIRWFETELCYCFHPMNAFDDGDTVVVDVPRLPSAYDTGPIAHESTRLERWTIDPADSKVRADLIDDTPQEFCRVDDRVIGSAHRYGYTIATGRDGAFDGTRVFKHDFRAGSRQAHDFGHGRHPGEFVFVPDPDRADEEDGGWLIGFVHDDRATFAVLDAQDVAADPVATVRLPGRVPYGFHGNWIPNVAGA